MATLQSTFELHMLLFYGLLALIGLDVAYAIMRRVLHRQAQGPALLDLLAQKVTIIFVVNVALVVETLVVAEAGLPLTDLVILFYCGVEALQVLDAAVRDGLPAPPQLRNVLNGLVGSSGAVPPPDAPAPPAGPDHP